MAKDKSENRQLTNPQDDQRGDINDGSFTGRWADAYPREKTSVHQPGKDDQDDNQDDQG